jgi:hypothetical protein
VWDRIIDVTEEYLLIDYSGNAIATAALPAMKPKKM